MHVKEIYFIRLILTQTKKESTFTKLSAVYALQGCVRYFKSFFNDSYLLMVKFLMGLTAKEIVTIVTVLITAYCHQDLSANINVLLSI